MKNIFLSIILIIIIVSTAKSQCSQILPKHLSLGANLNGLSDWDVDRPFNDIFKANRGLSADTNAPWNYIPPLIDNNGWSLQDFSVIVNVIQDSAYAGIYKIRFNGMATINPISSALMVQNQQYDSITNTTTAELVSYPSNTQIMLRFTHTKYSASVNGIKNIQIMKPGLDFDAPTFSQQFLNNIQRFEAFRFMDWHSSNWNADSLWFDRTLTTYSSQCGPYANHGIAWEYCIELANTLNKDIWINVPHKADDNYIYQLASLMYNTLNPNLKVYVEYSNELWNWGYSQAGWNLQQAIIEGNNGGNINYDNINDKYTWNYRRIANRGKQISDIFKSVFGADNFGNRLRPVYAVQAGWFDVGQRGIEFINNFYGSPKNYFYALAVAPYFNTSEIDTSDNATPSQVLQSLQNSVDSTFSGYTGLYNGLLQYAAISNYYGLQFVSYEGGPDTFGPHNIEAKKIASESPQIKTICEDFLEKWFAFGPSCLFNWFTAGAGNWDTQYGTWSLTENFENSFKLQAIDSVLNAEVNSPSVGFVLPGKFDGRQYAGYGLDWNNNIDFKPNWDGYFQYLLQVPQGKAGTYTFIAEAKYNSSQNSKVSIDNILLDSAVNVANNGSIDYINDTLGTVFLNEGLHTLRYTAGNIHIRNYIAIIDTLCNAVTSVNYPEKYSSFKIFPNPASDKINIEINGFSLPAQVSIYNSLGALAYNYKLLNTHETINIESLSPGLYLIKINSSIKKIIKE